MGVRRKGEGLGARLVERGNWGSRCLRGRDALEGKGPQRRPQKRLVRRLEEVAEAVGGGYCRLQMPVKLALGVRGTVAGHKPSALEGGWGGPTPPFQCIPGQGPTETAIPAVHRLDIAVQTSGHAEVHASKHLDTQTPRPPGVACHRDIKDRPRPDRHIQKGWRSWPPWRLSPTESGAQHMHRETATDCLM